MLFENLKAKKAKSMEHELQNPIVQEAPESLAENAHNPNGQETGRQKGFTKKLPKWLLIGVLAATGAGAAVGTILTADVVGEMPLAVSQAILVSEEDTQQTYNYVGITSPSGSHVARYDVDDANLENAPTIGTEFNDIEYAGVASSDGVRTGSRAILWYDYAQQIYGFKVEAPTQISEFTLDWEGYITFVDPAYPHTEKLVIWNNDTSSWELVSTAFNIYEEAVVPLNPDGTITATYTSNVDHYINSQGYLYIQMAAKGYYAWVHTDYVELQVKCTSQGLVIIGADRSHGQANDDRTSFIAAAEIDTGDYYHIKVPLKNMANQDMAARITVDAQDPLQVEVEGIGELADDGNLTHINRYQWGFVAPATLGDVSDADLKITVALPDDAPPGFYEIEVELEATEQ